MLMFMVMQMLVFMVVQMLVLMVVQMLVLMFVQMLMFMFVQMLVFMVERTLVFMVMQMLMSMPMQVLMSMFVGMLVPMLKHLAAFFSPMHFDRKMSSGDAAFLRLFSYEFHFRNAEGVQFLYECIRIGKQLQKSSGQHISGRSHPAVQIKNLHYDFTSI